jgi:uncharacterized membrane protein YfcA
MILFLIGLASGIISGMGIGGGAILIPALIIFVKPEQHIVQSVNLLFFIPTAIVALIIHIKNKSIDFKTSIPIVIFGLIGSYLGSRLAMTISGPTLRKTFAVFLLAIAVYEFMKPGKKVAKKG